MPSNLLEILDANIWMNILRLFITMNTFITNSFLIYLFARFPELRKNLCNKLIQLNAIMDFICGRIASYIFYFIFTSKGFGPASRAIFQFYLAGTQIKEFSKLTCIFILSPYAFGLSGSQITFIAISIDRLIAIARPLDYMCRRRS